MDSNLCLSYTSACGAIHWSTGSLPGAQLSGKPASPHPEAIACPESLSYMWASWELSYLWALVTCGQSWSPSYAMPEAWLALSVPEDSVACGLLSPVFSPEPGPI